MAKDERDAPLTDDERALRRLLDQAVLYTWVEHEGGRKLVFEHALHLQDFFEMMMRRGDKGFDLGAKLFLDAVERQAMPRAVRSHLLRRLARALHDLATGSPERDAPGVAPTFGPSDLTESEVAGFGRFLDPLLRGVPDVVVEWAEDMDTDDPQHDLRRQPTAMLRGALLSTRVDLTKCVQFWELAAASGKFPLRIFTDPCHSADGVIFSMYHVRRFSLLLSAVSLAAAHHFASYMRTHVTHKSVRVALGGGYFGQERQEASKQECANALAQVAGAIPDKKRQLAVSESFGLPAVA